MEKQVQRYVLAEIAVHNRNLKDTPSIKGRVFSCLTKVGKYQKSVYFSIVNRCLPNKYLLSLGTLPTNRA